MVHVNIFFHQCKIFSNRTIFSLNILSTHSWKNGVIERKYHHILDTTRALLISTFVPHYLWAEAILIVVLINITPSFLLDDTSPYLRLFNSQLIIPLIVDLVVCVSPSSSMNVWNFLTYSKIHISWDSSSPVSYTHLTLPTIYSV